VTGSSSSWSPAWSAVADVTEIGAGTQLLDVGCGTGRFCELAAGRGAAVHGVDSMADRIERARIRVREGDFRLGFMEQLPWPDAAFDVVTGFNSFQYAFDVDMALAEARRVARRGAPIAVCNWGRPEDNEFFAFLVALEAGGLRMERLPATDPVDQAIDRVGLDVIATGIVPAPILMPDAAALEEALVEAGAVSGRGGERQRHRLTAAAAPFHRPDGSYRFENRLRYRIVRA
jgi:SAM-dependent methyltransferase